MLWLHYEKNWSLDSFAGHILGRLFGADPTLALAKAKEIHTREFVADWMRGQEMAAKRTTLPQERRTHLDHSSASTETKNDGEWL